MLKEVTLIAKCMDKIDSKYRLVAVAAKRARQLVSKKKETAQDFPKLALVKTQFKKPSTIALDEFAQGAISYEVNQDAEKQPENQ